MKIALVCHKYTLTRGGLERDTVFLSRALSRAGHAVHVFANKWDCEPGITFHHVPMLRASSVTKNLSFAFFAQRRLAQARFDVIQSMERIFYQDIFRASDGISPIQMRNRYADPAFRRLMALTPRRLALQYLEKRSFSPSGSKKILALSQISKREIVEHYQVPPQKIEVIYNGVDIQKFNPAVKDSHCALVRKKHGIMPDDIVLLFISNNHKRKNLQLLLEAVHRLKNERLKILVVGNDNAAPYLRWATGKGIHGQIVFTGPQRNVENYYGAADIFVLPSHYDVFGNVCLEAMACGLPVIVSQTCGASELIRDGEDGFIVPNGNARLLADKIARLQSADQRARVGEKALKTAISYSMQRHMDRILMLYETVRKANAA